MQFPIPPPYPCRFFPNHLLQVLTRIADLIEKYADELAAIESLASSKMYHMLLESQHQLVTF